MMRTCQQTWRARGYHEFIECIERAGGLAQSLAPCKELVPGKGYRNGKFWRPGIGNHRITESQNGRGWRGPLWVI